MTFHFMLLFGSFILLLCASILLTIKTRFVQIRTIPRMISLLRSSFSSKEHSAYTIKPHKALFTAMATTIGIGNIIYPLLAIGLGGPGALVGFLLATIFGAAATFVEVTFALKYKDPAPLKDRIGGPMFYLNKVFHPIVGYLYAFFGLILIIFWSGGQSNALATMLVPYHIPPLITGSLLAVFTFIVVTGGIKRVGNVSEKIVPIMFLLYTSAMLVIICCNAHKLGYAFSLIASSLFEPVAVGSGFIGGSVVQALRWGLAKGFSSNESGIGTATVPHSKAEAHSSVDQGILSIVSVFSNGVLCLLSGLAILVTDAYKDFGTASITIITNLFGSYFPGIGPAILLFSATLFAVSTIIGNSYNGSQFFLYAIGKRGIYLYHGICALSILYSAMFSLEAVQNVVDYLTIPVVVPHILGLVVLAYRYSDDLEIAQHQKPLN